MSGSRCCEYRASLLSYQCSPPPYLSGNRREQWHLFWPAYEGGLLNAKVKVISSNVVMLFNLFWSIGGTLGPALSSYLYNDSNPFRPFYLSGVFMCLPWQPSSLERFTKLRHFQTACSRSTKRSIPVTCSERASQLGALCDLRPGSALGVLRRLAPKLTKEMGMPPTIFGNLMLGLGVLQTLAFVVLGTNLLNTMALPFRTSRHRPVVVSCQFPCDMANPAYTFVGVCVCKVSASLSLSPISVASTTDWIGMWTKGLRVAGTKRYWG